MPDKRSAGRAMSAPTAAVMRTAHRMAMGLPWAPAWATTTMPMPARLSWHSEICPAKPTNGIMDSPMMAKPHVLAALTMLALLITAVSMAAPTTMTAPKKIVPARWASWRSPGCAAPGGRAGGPAGGSGGR